MENIGNENNADAFYRYKMPKMIIKIEGNGNGIKTKIINLDDIAKALDRSSDYLLKFFIYELGTSCKIIKNDKQVEYIIMGSHNLVDLKLILEHFIKMYVQCYTCGNPETALLFRKNQKNLTETIIKKKCLQLECKACGNFSIINPTNKLVDYIIKHITK